jgi:hypothetical protein
MPKSALGPNRTSRIDTPCPFSQCDAKERSRLYMLEPTLLSFFSSRAQPELVTNFLVRKCPVTRFSCRNRRGRILEAKDLAISFVCYVLCCRASAGVSFLENPHILGPELSNLILGLCSIIFIAIGMLLIFCHKKIQVLSELVRGDFDRNYFNLSQASSSVITLLANYLILSI